MIFDNLDARSYGYSDEFKEGFMQMMRDMNIKQYNIFDRIISFFGANNKFSALENASRIWEMEALRMDRCVFKNSSCIYNEVMRDMHYHFFRCMYIEDDVRSGFDESDFKHHVRYYTSYHLLISDLFYQEVSPSDIDLDNDYIDMIKGYNDLISGMSSDIIESESICPLMTDFFFGFDESNIVIRSAIHYIFDVTPINMRSITAFIVSRVCDDYKERLIHAMSEIFALRLLYTGYDSRMLAIKEAAETVYKICNIRKLYSMEDIVEKLNDL